MEFIRGHVTLPSETDVTFYQDNVLQDPEQVLFTVYDQVSTPGTDIIVGVPNLAATKISNGRWYARFEVPENAALGAYKIVYNYAIRDSNNNLLTQALESTFNVVSQVTSTISSASQHFVNRLRVVLRDNNPDAYYRFAPPLKTGEIKGFTTKTGYIWQDDELEIFLDLATNELKATPFGTSVQSYPNLQARFEPAVMMTSAFYATFSEAIRWTSEEFTYDIDGVSLSIDRSSKFQALADGMRGAAEAQLDFLAKSIRYVKGVKMVSSVSRGAVLGPSVAHSPIHNFISSRYSV